MNPYKADYNGLITRFAVSYTHLYTQVVWGKETGEHTFYAYIPYNKDNTSAKAVAGVLSNSQLQSGTSNAHLTNTALMYATAKSAEVETAVPMTLDRKSVV